MLDVFITSRVRRKIVIVFAKFPGFKTHVRGLSKLIKEDAGNIQRELRRLEKNGFLTVEKKGNSNIYSANRDFLLFKEIQSMVIKSGQQSAKPPSIGRSNNLVQ
ncbi:MAG: winged helix-turn-helix domain-containing protein [Candidatus Nomurabacteria bacterium]|nr:winged helix-turn-helix domain-containing protein [Candidatus Nomurabacteria bacterium]